MSAHRDGYEAISQPEQIRRLNKIIVLGTVEEVQYGTPGRPRVRVRAGKLLTGWIPFGQHRSGDNRSWEPLDIGEQVVMASPSGDLAQAVIVTTLPRDDRPAPDTSPDKTVQTFKDGSREEHDRASKTRTVTMPDDGKIVFKVGATTLELTNEGTTLKTPSLTVDSPASEFKGSVMIRKLLSYMGGLFGQNTTGEIGNRTAVIQGSLVHENGDLMSNGTIVHTHVHGNSGPPTGNNGSAGTGN